MQVKTRKKLKYIKIKIYYVFPAGIAAGEKQGYNVSVILIYNGGCRNARKQNK